MDVVARHLDAGNDGSPFLRFEFRHATDPSC
jgi:hypothetical protein